MDFNRLDSADFRTQLSQDENADWDNIMKMYALDGWEYDESNNTYNLVIKIINNSKNPDPVYQKEGDSGFDLTANLLDGETIIINPLKRAVIPTGLHFQVPIGFELQVRPRSGLALKNGITVLNTPGTVDSGYRGEVKIVLFNTDESPFVVKNGDRIAQGVISAVQQKHSTIIKRVNSLDASDRGDNGFGSTGV